MAVVGPDEHASAHDHRSASQPRIAHLFDGETARGRVTVERSGESYTLLSMRGQGLSDSTKQIPPMYSQAKQAILVLRNRTPTLRVVGARRDPLSR